MRILLPALLSLAMAATALAQQPAPGRPARGQAGGIQGPCRDDAQKYCKDVQPGEGRIVACLEGSGDKVTPACRSWIAQGQERRKAAEARRKSAQPPAPKPAAPPESKK